MDFLKELIEKNIKVNYTMNIINLFSKNEIENKLSKFLTEEEEKKIMNNKNINSISIPINNMLEKLFEENQELKNSVDYLKWYLIKKYYDVKKKENALYYITRNPVSIFEIVYNFNENCVNLFSDSEKFKNIRNYHNIRNKNYDGYSFHNLNQKEFDEIAKVLFEIKKN